MRQLEKIRSRSEIRYVWRNLEYTFLVFTIPYNNDKQDKWRFWKCTWSQTCVNCLPTQNCLIITQCKLMKDNQVHFFHVNCKIFINLDAEKCTVLTELFWLFPISAGTMPRDHKLQLPPDISCWALVDKQKTHFNKYVSFS